MKNIALLVSSASVLALAPGAAADFAPDALPPTWHVHDCTSSSCTFPHAAVSFFPKILTDGNVAAYLTDPAECPDATDKALLGGGEPPQLDGALGPNQPLGEGICQTSTTVIHLKRISPDQPIPDGWTFLRDDTVGGVVYATYYLLTAN